MSGSQQMSSGQNPLNLSSCYYRLYIAFFGGSISLYSASCTWQKNHAITKVVLSGVQPFDVSDDVRWCQMNFPWFSKAQMARQKPENVTGVQLRTENLHALQAQELGWQASGQSGLDRVTELPGAGWVLRHSHDIRSPHDAERFQDIQSQGHFIFDVDMIKPLRYHMGRLWKAPTQLCEFAVVKVALSVPCGLLRTNQPPSMCDEHGSNICALNQACKRRITSSSSVKLCWRGMQDDARPLRLKDVAFCFKRCTACPLMGFRGPNHPAKHFAVDLNRGRGHYQSPELNQWLMKTSAGQKTR